MAQLVQACSKLARASLPVSRRGLSSAVCGPSQVRKSADNRRNAPGEAKAEAEKCELDFKKREVWPFDEPCDCQEPPALSGCEDVGQPRAACFRSVRQYGCHCDEQVEEQCDEELMEPASKQCELDFKKREVNPYDDPCGCNEPAAAVSCETLHQRETCCRSSLPFGCMCDAYERPRLECAKQKAPPAQAKKKECGSKRPATKCS